MDGERSRDGYQIPWIDSPPTLSANPLPFPSYPPGSPKALALAQEIRSMLEKDALEVVEDGLQASTVASSLWRRPLAVGDRSSTSLL